MGRPKKQLEINEELVEVAEEVSESIKEEIVKHLEVEPIKEEPKKAPVKTRNVITISTSNLTVSDLEVPIGIDKVWGKDQTAPFRTKPNSMVDIIIPNECSFNKWIKYYKGFTALGIRVLKFGTEEVK